MNNRKINNTNSLVTYLTNVSKKDKIILFITIIIIICTVFMKKVLLPQINEYDDKINEIVFLKDKQEKAEKAYDENIILESQIGKLRNTYDTISGKISKTPRLAQVIYDIENMIIENKLKLVAVNVLENDDVTEEESLEKIKRGIEKKEESKNNIEKVDLITYIGLDINVVGDYNSIIKLIKSIESYGRLSEIVDVNINGKDKELVSRLRIKFYNLNGKENEEYEFNTSKYGKVNSFE